MLPNLAHFALKARRFFVCDSSAFARYRPSVLSSAAVALFDQGPARDREGSRPLSISAINSETVHPWGRAIPLGDPRRHLQGRW